MVTSRLLFLLAVALALTGGSSYAGAFDTYRADMGRAPQWPPNVRVTHDRFPAHAEPYLAVNPRNPRNLLGATQDVNGAGLPVAGTFVSFDGGRSWRDNGPLPMPAGFNDSLDVTVVFDTAGHALVAALLGNAGPNTFSARRGLAIWRTIDGGRRFGRPVVLVRGQFADHPWLAINPPVTGRHAHHQTIYLVWASNNGLSLSRSTDDGRRFTHPSSIPRTGRLVGDPVITAGPVGRIDVVYYAIASDGRYSIRAISSANGGRTFGDPQTVPEAPGQTLLYGKGVPSSRVAAAVDAKHHLLYVTYAAYRGSPRTADVMVARSADDGKTWDKPARVDRSSSAPTMDQQPQIAVTQRGQVVVSYFALSRGLMNVYLGRSTTRGAGFHMPQRITTGPFNPNLGIKTVERGTWWIGDYQGLAASANVVYPCWSDTRSGHLEIYVAKVPVG